MGAELYGKRCKENGYGYKVELVYTAGDSWCSEVIKLAVLEAGYDFEKLKLDSEDLDLKATLKRGQYLKHCNVRRWLPVSGQQHNEDDHHQHQSELHKRPSMLP